MNQHFPKRLDRITYPGTTARRQVAYTRSGAGGALPDWQRLDWLSGRVTELQDSRSGEATHTVTYGYQGGARVVSVVYDKCGGAVTLQSTDGPGGALGFDSFGGVRTLRATRNNGAETLVDLTYGYDRLHSPVSRTDAGPLSKDDAFRQGGAGRRVGHDVEGEPEGSWEVIARRPPAAGGDPSPVMSESCRTLPPA